MLFITWLIGPIWDLSCVIIHSVIIKGDIKEVICRWLNKQIVCFAISEIWLHQLNSICFIPFVVVILHVSYGACPIVVSNVLVLRGARL